MAANKITPAVQAVDRANVQAAGLIGSSTYTPQDSQDFEDSQDQQDLEDTKDEQRPPRVNSERVDNEGQLLALPLIRYVAWAIEYTVDASEEDNAKNNEPWHSAMWAFTRLCRAHPFLRDLSDVQAMKAVETTLRDLGASPYGPELRAKIGSRPQTDPWTVWFPLAGDSEDIRRDFMASWLSVRFVPFTDILESAADRAKKRPLAPRHDRGKLYQRFISLAGALQVLMGDRPILLPTRRIAMLLDCNQRTVSDLRKFAMHDGLLVVTREHAYEPLERRATEFHFAIERWTGGSKL